MYREPNIRYVSTVAWGNLRNPTTWSGCFTGTPLIDRGFTGHEHLYGFGLINMNGRMYDPVMSSFLSVDSYVQDPENSQNFNRYAYCFNNPLRYTDPSGEVVVIDDIIAAAIVGAIINGVVQTASGHVDSFGDWCLATVIGGAAGAAGAWAGGAAAGSLAGFYGGAVSGAVGGATGGFINGAGNTWMNGGSFSDGLASGFYGAGTGFLGGGLMGGLMGGISAWNRGYRFLDGRGTPSYFHVKDMPEAYVNNTGFDKKRWDINPEVKADYNRRLRYNAIELFDDYTKFNTSTITTDPSFLNTTDGKSEIWINSNGYLGSLEGEAYGATIPYDNGITKVLISPSVVDYIGTENDAFFGAILGHEYTHAVHYYFGLPVSQDGPSEAAALEFTKAYCYSHGMSTTNINYNFKRLTTYPDFYIIPKEYPFSIHNFK